MLSSEADEGQRDLFCPPRARQIEVDASPFYITNILCSRASIGENKNELANVSISGRVATNGLSSTSSAKPCQAFKPKTTERNDPLFDSRRSNRSLLSKRLAAASLSTLARTWTVFDGVPPANEMFRPGMCSLCVTNSLSRGRCLHTRFL